MGDTNCVKAVSGWPKKGGSEVMDPKLSQGLVNIYGETDDFGAPALLRNIKCRVLLNSMVLVLFSQSLQSFGV